MPDLIDRNIIVEKINQIIYEYYSETKSIAKRILITNIGCKIIKCIAKSPKVNISNIERQAHWIKTYNEITDEFVFECSNCGHEIGNVDDKQLVNIKYCWNCGCEMDNG